jgi:Transposase IS66 family/IS66 C-terminal element
VGVSFVEVGIVPPLIFKRDGLRTIIQVSNQSRSSQRSKPFCANSVSAKSDIAKAINYSLNRWTAFTRFLDDGRICLSNNAAERAVRGVAIGRANWTFAGSDAGGRRAAAVYTLVETCKLNDVDPQAWLAKRK